MEEKERYRLIGLDTSQGLVDKIYDTKKDIIICSVGDADDVDNVIELLNQQDKENQQLKQQLEDTEFRLENLHNLYYKDTEELKQQLHDLPKKE